MNTYDIGDVCVPRFELRTSTDPASLFDPASLSIRVRTPRGTKYTLTYGVDSAVVRVSTGIYTAEIHCNVAGRWDYKWTALRPANVPLAVEYGAFEVRAAPADLS
jgi:hypothetical protein